VTKTVTVLLIVLTILTLGVWDVYAVANETPGDTISEIVLKASLRRPIIPFIIGVVCGHLFWPQERE
jgi:hypothetical protein